MHKSKPIPHITEEMPGHLKSLNLHKYEGKWYVIASIPTRFDKNWNYVTETYSINKKGHIDIFTTYVKEGERDERSVRSKGFPVPKSHNMKWKIQYFWPFTIDYLIEELPEDYSYVVVGHPKKKFLYIMNRSGVMSPHREIEIVERCRKKGYNIAKLKKVRQVSER
jgi:apolipoprotein D and lipocalin family protein